MHRSVPVLNNSTSEVTAAAGSRERDIIKAADQRDTLLFFQISKSKSKIIIIKSDRSVIKRRKEEEGQNVCGR